MAYFMWRIIIGLNREITMSFLLVGHTKFAPDWCFGLFKRLYKRTKVNCLDDIADVVRNSVSVNHPQLVGHQGGTSIVPFYDWSNYFEEYTTKTALKGISQMQHFQFNAAFLGYVFVKETSDGEECLLKLVKDITWKPSLSNLPDLIPPPGLTLERQWYLHQKCENFAVRTPKILFAPYQHNRYHNTHYYVFTKHLSCIVIA